MYGGYCFLNNAAIAAQFLCDHGAARVAILDVDFHHGNGTQDIFYSRADVLYVSLHGDPAEAFPYFSGYADETGVGAGKDYTELAASRHRIPIWVKALGNALDRIALRPRRLFGGVARRRYLAGDPISFFKLQSPDFSTYGRMIGECKLPTLFVSRAGTP